YIMQEYGFTKEAISDLFNSQRPGAEILSETHHAIQDRDQVIIHPRGMNVEEAFEMIITEPGRFTMPWGASYNITIEDHLELGRKNEVEYLGFEQNPFPIKVRPRKPGDVFRPLGLNGKSQKVKDLITNMKLDYISKS